MKGIFPRRLGDDSSYDLEGDIFVDEIKKAVWDCGYDKSLSPDGFTFEFFKKIWPLVGKYVSNAVKEFFNSSIFPNGCNPSFIALIPNVLDAKNLNELISHEQSAFIKGMFVPILVGKNDLVPISHLFYADDVMFIRKWSSSNVKVLMMMLHWFFLGSGLEVNVYKNSLYGLGVHSLDIQSMANSFGCLANNLPFTYLGVKVAANMACINSWNKVIQKVTIKISKWKAKSLSVGVKSDREEIDKHLLITSSSSMRWSKLLPIKLDVFVWHMFLDKHPTMINLSNRGLDVPCVLCPNYRNAVESLNHLFYGFSMVLDLFQLLGRWWNIDIINLIYPVEN
ncbi:RNA-directed DNA polymerase, eukaryota, reverse transcriptase zinc-binding domain protein [Tanacetum coccineum]|uniref:RNA-directed DNA polymerase, eukaryota, reverse transcriptase zinc-binding domain protein n=1 Tax=Tanacetum coccineum TaxID=301880 RepID=A0ABQ5BNP6_9ASTR